MKISECLSNELKIFGDHPNPNGVSVAIENGSMPAPDKHL